MIKNENDDSAMTVKNVFRSASGIFPLFSASTVIFAAIYIAQYPSAPVTDSSAMFNIQP